METQIASDSPAPGHELTGPMAHSLAPLSRRIERVGSPSAWWQHVAFAQWLVSAAAPRCLVELGTHAGVSYAAFCEAVATTGIGTKCYAVDTWLGDDQAGHFGAEVYDDLARFHDDRYSTFSTLLRSTFDAALERFADGTIDILHIDGFHTYEAVQHDFETWRPKLSDRAVVLFHDTNEHADSFGVWQLWAELRGQYPSFEFLHGHGLGVLAVGQHAPAAITALCAIEDAAALASLRGLFARLGERWWFETRERMASAELSRQAAATAGQLAALEADAAQQSAAFQTELTALEARSQRAEAALADTETLRQDEAASARSREAHLAEQLDAAIAQASQLATAAGLREAALLRESHEARTGTLLAVERERQRAAEIHALDGQVASLRRDALQERRRAHDAAAAHASVVAKLAAAKTALADAEARRADQARMLQHVRAERDHAAHERDVVFSSSLWRAAQPLRAAGRYVPAGMRRAVGETARISWWTATMSLRRKLRERRKVTPPERDAPAVEAPWPAEAETAALGDLSFPVPPAATMPVSVPPPPRSVVWISGEHDTPGHVYRVIRPLAAAAALGMATSWMRPDEVPSRILEIETADTVVIWRAPWDENIALLFDAARRCNVKTIFDVDDLMVDPSLARLDVIDGIRSQNLTENTVQALYGRIRSTMLAVDLCVATTEELAGHMRRAFMPAIVVPNGFDRATWRMSRLAARRRAAQPGDGLVRLGYAGGSRTHQRDFGLCADAVATVLAARPECRLVLFRTPEHGYPCLDVHEFPMLLGLEDRIEWRDMVPLEQLPAELARLSVNLAPLEIGNAFCEAKSELKVFEAAIAGVPTVASSTGPFSRALRHGETGFLAVTSANWLDAITRLVDDAALRRRLAAAAGLDALWAFGPERRAQEIEAMLDMAQGGRTAAKAFTPMARSRPRARSALPVVPAFEVLLETDTYALADATVVIPLYNYAHTVIEALDSAHAQSHEQLDLVVVDDGSTDGSVDVVLEWAASHAKRFNRVVIARNRANQGLGATRNAGFSLADTPWIMALDADNRLRPGCVASCLQTAESTGAAFAYPLIQHFGDSTDQIGSPDWNPARLIQGNFIDAMALISRAAWAGVGGYDTVRTGWEDFDLWCRFAENGLRGERVPGEPLAEYRVHGTSMIKDAMRQREKVRWMMGHLTQQHPWLSLISPVPETSPAPGTAVEPAPAIHAAALNDRWRDLLPLLRCPTTGGMLTLDAAGDALISEDGSCRWPVVAGRPVLFPGMGTPRVVGDSHLSNALPDSAAALIRSTQGKVLHLSAGGSAERYEHVVEAEAAIFRHTDVIADVHHLPFPDESFEAVIALNAFEHYRDPKQAAREIMRVLKPGGPALIRTAFLQPQHEAPWHFYGCTRYGLEAWFDGFDTEKLWVSENFHAGYALSWIASECEAALRRYVSAGSADQFLDTPMKQVVACWRAPEQARGVGDPVWAALSALPQEAQQVVAAGFEYLGRKPNRGSGPASNQ